MYRPYNATQDGAIVACKSSSSQCFQDKLIGRGASKHFFSERPLK